MKANPTKYNLTGAKKKKSPSIGDRAYGALIGAGKVAKSFNEAVLPIKEVKRIAKGKGSKGDYAYTALSALPLIGKAGKVAGVASKMGTRGTRVSKPYATKVASAISKSSKPIGKSGKTSNAIARSEKASTAIARSKKASSQIKKVVVNDTNRTMRASELKQIKAATSTARSTKTSSQVKRAISDASKMRPSELKQLRAAFNQRNSTSKAFGKYSEVDAKRAFNVSDRQIAAVRKNRGSPTSPQRMKNLRREGVELQRQGGTYPADRPKPSIPQRQAKVTKRRQADPRLSTSRINVAAQKYSNAYKRLQK